MKYIKIGKIVNTHGIKGEIRIINSFKEKELIYKKDMIMYIGNNKEKVIVNTYRHHKDYEMITLNGFNDINEVLRFKGEFIYIDRDDLKLKDNEYILTDLINLEVYDNDTYLGKVDDIINNNTLLYVIGKKNFYIPINSPYLKKVDIKNKRIETNNGSDLILWK